MMRNAAGMSIDDVVWDFGISVSNLIFFFSNRRRHTRWNCDWSSDVCSSDLAAMTVAVVTEEDVDRHRSLRLGGVQGLRNGLHHLLLVHVLLLVRGNDDLHGAGSSRPEGPEKGAASAGKPRHPGTIWGRGPESRKSRGFPLDPPAVAGYAWPSGPHLPRRPRCPRSPATAL